jgi:predicted RNA binding protein YcfA (HicA-like mRNA interferase family)
MPKKIRELKAMLRKAGFASREGKGSHTVWFHARLKHRDDMIVLSGGEGDDAKPYQERDVARALRKLEALDE